MAKMITQDELQYLEHVNKMLRETRTLLADVERETKERLDTFLPILAQYVNGVRAVQLDLTRIVHEMLKNSKELKFVAGNHQEILAYATALIKLGEVFNSKEVQSVLEIVTKKDKEL